jgi:hypothetical protein
VQLSASGISASPDFLPTTAEVLCGNPHFRHFQPVFGQFQAIFQPLVV